MKLGKIKQYEAVKNHLDSLKALENELRIEICDSISTEIGTTHSLIGNYKLTSARGLTYNLNKSVLEDVKLTAEELACIRLATSLDKAKYDELPSGNALEEYITVKPAMPTLKISILEDQTPAEQDASVKKYMSHLINEDGVS